jgi:hypothetical protein
MDMSNAKQTAEQLINQSIETGGAVEAEYSEELHRTLAGMAATIGAGPGNTIYIGFGAKGGWQVVVKNAVN